MLMTFICPKMIASPSAIKRNTENRLNPAKPCMIKMSLSSAKEVASTRDTIASPGKTHTPKADQSGFTKTRRPRRARGKAAAGRARVRPKELLVALGERIRLDQVGRFRNHIELTVDPHLPDAGLRPEGMVFGKPAAPFAAALDLKSFRCRGV